MKGWDLLNSHTETDVSPKEVSKKLKNIQDYQTLNFKLCEQVMNMQLYFYLT
jgi:hypothetical protein